MPRSRVRSGRFTAFAGLLVLVALAAPARGAEPDAATFLDIAEAMGLQCEEQTEADWSCQPPVDQETYVSLNFSDSGEEFYSSFYVSAAEIRYDVGGPAPASDAFLAGLEDLVSAALDDDAAGLTWLAEMNAGPSASGEFSQDDWTLTWTSAEYDAGDVINSQVALDMMHFPSGDPVPTSSSQPIASFEPPSDWSAEGSSTYQGMWTVTELAFDGGGTPEYEIGDSVPGTLIVDCTAADGFCGLEGTFDGELGVALSLVAVSEGVARYDNREALANCDGGQTLTRTLDLEFGPSAATATDEFVYDPRTCDDEGGTLFFTDVTWSFAGSLVAYTPPAGTSPSSDPAPTASGAEAPTPVEPVDEGSAVGNESALPFAASVPALAEVSTDPIVVLQSAALAALLVFLMPFPSQLFNSTLETHEDEIRRWFRFDRMGAVAGGIGALWASWPGVTLFTLLAALLYGFLDPGFGFDLESLATFVGMLLGIVLVTAAFAVPLALAHRRHGDQASLKVVPVSLLIGVACVLLSRLTGFQPGYLYGLLIGLAFARELSAAEEGRATALGAALMLAVALVAWVGLGALPDGVDFGLVVARTALAALMVAGLEGVVFGLLPMRFLPGESLYAWNRVAWGALLALGAFAFFHILINPASGYLSDTSRTPLFTVLGLLVGFSAVSVAFWAWFRFRDHPSEPSTATSSD